MSVQLAAARKGIRPPFSGQGNRYKAGGESRGGLSGLKSFSMGLVSVSLGLSFFLCLSLGLLAGYRWLTNNAFFTLNEIVVSGNERLNYNQVLESAGINLGMNTLGLNIGQAESGLSANPWVEKAAVKRILPNRVQITVTEKIPRFWIRTGEEIQYADARARVISKLEPDLFEALPVVDPGERAADGLDRLAQLIALSDKGEVPFDLDQAAWVRFEADDQLCIHFDRTGLEVVVGINGWDMNLKRLKTVWTDLARRGESGRVRGIRAVGGEVWVVRSGTEKGSAEKNNIFPEQEKGDGQV